MQGMMNSIQKQFQFIGNLISEPTELGPLFVNIEQGNIEEVERVLGEKPELVNAWEKTHGSTPLFSMLYQVVRNENFTDELKDRYISLIAQIIRNHGNDIDFDLKTNRGDTVLEYVAYQNSVLQGRLNPVVEAVEPYLTDAQATLHFARNKTEGVEVKYAMCESAIESTSIFQKALNVFEKVKSILIGNPPPRLMEGHVPNIGTCKDPIHSKFDKDRPGVEWFNVVYPNQALDGLLAMARANEQYRPSMLGIGEINEAFDFYQKMPRRINAFGPTFNVAIHCSALELPSLPCMKNAVLGLASQGNILECTCRDAPSLTAYSSDPTQGPKSQQATVDAAVARFAYSADSDMFLDMLASAKDPVHYVNGYLTPSMKNIPSQTSHFIENYQSIRMNVQQARVDGANERDDHFVTQVLLCAPALNYYLFRMFEGPWDRPPSQSERDQMAEFSKAVLMPQFLALAKIAILKAEATGTRIPLVIPLVGLGAFGIKKEVVVECIQSAIDLVRDSGASVDVVLSAYAEDEVVNYGGIVKDEAGNFSKGGKSVFRSEDRVTPYQFSDLEQLKDGSFLSALGL